MTVLEVENLKKIYRPRFGGNQVQALSKAVSYTHLTLPTTSRV